LDSKENFDVMPGLFHLWEKKNPILIVALLGLIISYFSSFFVEKSYESNITVIPDTPYSSSGDSSNAIGNLLGITTGTAVEKDVIKALKIMTSLPFLEEFSKKNNFDLKYFNSDSSYDNLNFNSSIDSLKSNENLENFNEDKAISIFLKSKISYEISPPLVTITIESKSPFFSKLLLDSLIENINSFLGEKQKKTALRRIDFLKNEIKKVDNKTTETILFDLLSDSYSSISLADVKEEYIFETIEPATLDTSLKFPNRKNFAFMGVLIGFLFSAMFFLFNFYILDRSLKD
jgi:LPS O-antigen subunit length determinant protein (WzzB/FepE family)